MNARLLSKSKYMSGLQCPKLLWMQFHETESIPSPDASTQHLFDEGHRIGELAKKLYPDGINIPASDFSGNLAQTKILLGQRKTLFEPAFFIESLYSRLDILTPAPNDEWDIVEVKGSTRVKDENLDDVSFQRFCAEKFGLKIRRCFLTFINNQYVKSGDIEPEKLFTSQDITEQVTEAADGIQDRIKEMFKIINSPTCPAVSVGAHCTEPYSCPVTSCWDSLPEHNIFELYRGGKKCTDLYEKGIQTIKDIPAGFKLSMPQQIQKECVLSGEPHVDKEAIKYFLSSLQYPLYYLDFETINPAIPIYDGTRPFQRIPFQFSLHITEKPNSMPAHYSFLADGAGDPRFQLLSELKSEFSGSGTVVTYNQSFEKGVLQELAAAFPEYKNWVDDVCGRLVDLYAPFRDFNYYHPSQNGSASIKHVLPAVTGKSYEGMSIANGGDASLAFLSIIYGSMTDGERAKLRFDLEKYCGLDSEGMIWVVDKLSQFLT
jgi:hypothetical protein